VGDDGEDSPERREGAPAADIRVCARVWRKEGARGGRRSEGSPAKAAAVGRCVLCACAVLCCVGCEGHG
jgi:hypothetical protein